MPVRLGPFRVARPLRSIETRSRPRLLAATRRGFTFYVADPVSSIRFSLGLNCDLSRWFAACAKRDYTEANAQAEED